MLTKKYPYTVEGLRMKYGEDLKNVVLKDMKYCLGWAGTISKIIGKEDIIEEVEYTENPLEFRITLDNGLEILGNRFGWFLNDYSFTFEKDGEIFKYRANLNSNQHFMKKLQDLYCTSEQLCLYYVNLYAFRMIVEFGALMIFTSARQKKFMKLWIFMVNRRLENTQTFSMINNK